MKQYFIRLGTAIFGAVCLFTIGLILSITIIGAALGVPLVIVALAMLVFSPISALFTIKRTV